MIARGTAVTPGRNDPPVIRGRFAWLGVGLSHAHTIGRRGLRAHNQDHLLITRHGMFDCHRDAAGLWTPLALPLHYDASRSRKDVAILTINRRVAEIESAAMGTIFNRIGNCIGELLFHSPLTNNDQSLWCPPKPQPVWEDPQTTPWTGQAVRYRSTNFSSLTRSRAARGWSSLTTPLQMPEVRIYGNRACMFTKQACYKGSWAALAFIMHHLHAGTASNTASVPSRESESVSTVQPAPGSCDQQGECEAACMLSPLWLSYNDDCVTGRANVYHDQSH